MALTEKTEGELPLPKYLRLPYVLRMVRSLHQEGLDLVHFITLHESLEHCIIRQKWKIRLHFSYPKCYFFCLLFQICQNKVFYFRLNKIFCMDPKWLGFLFSKKGKRIIQTRMKKMTQNEIFIFQSSFQIKAYISWRVLIHRSDLKSCWISPL